MSAEDTTTTIYIFVVFSDVRRLEILVSVSLHRSFFLRKIVVLALVLAIVKQILFLAAAITTDGMRQNIYFTPSSLPADFPI